MLKVKYPIREITLDTEYKKQGHQVQIKTAFNPNSAKSSRKLEGTLKLDATGDLSTEHKTTMDLTLKHPALQQVKIHVLKPFLGTF